jgi:acyl carrier protein phosphodiesterase
MIGNLLADLVKPSEQRELAFAIKQGIDLHREIDSFTDRHPQSKELKRILRNSQGKYAAVAVDLVWDYYLSRDWLSYSSDSLPQFTGALYPKILSQKDIIPKRIGEQLQIMIENDFLMAYSSRERMQRSLSWMDKRASFPSAFINLLDDIDKHDLLFAKMFHSFFPDVQEFVLEYCRC